MKYWDNYTLLVKNNCTNSVQNTKDLEYWRNDLFAGIIIYLLPLSLIALLPGLYWSFISGLAVLVIVDISVVTGIIMIAFMPGMTIAQRKIIFVCCIYTLSYVLLYFLGVSGPGLLYLLSAGIFSILIFPSAYAFWPAYANSVICLLYVVFISFNMISWPMAQDHMLGEWIAVSSNVVFLSFLSSALIPRLFDGLQETIDKEKEVKEKLNEQQQVLEHALNMLQGKNGELEQFAYVASHDLNEPLRMITSFMVLLKNKYGLQLDEKAHTYIDFALDGGKRMQKMIADLLELSRTGRHDTEKEKVNLEDIIEEVRQNIFKLIEETQAKIIYKTSLPVLNFSRTDMTRLIQNLVSNAIKFRKKEINPIIEVSAIEKKSGWLFSIEDNGIGIEMGKSNHVFEVFTRLHSAAEYEGTGIGLAICKKIVEQNGGKIWVESGEDRGCTFYFMINK